MVKSSPYGILMSNLESATLQCIDLKSSLLPPFSMERTKERQHHAGIAKVVSVRKRTVRQGVALCVLAGVVCAAGGKGMGKHRKMYEVAYAARLKVARQDIAASLI